MIGQCIGKDTETLRQKRNKIVRHTLAMTILCQPSYQVSWLWIRQLDRILKYGPRCDKARLWDLKIMQMNGYYRFGIHEAYHFWPEEMKKDFLKSWAKENDYDYLWWNNNSNICSVRDKNEYRELFDEIKTF
jgi:hypothetical protein